MKISELITDKYKLRIPPTVYYELLADVVEAEEEQKPCNTDTCKVVKAYMNEWDKPNNSDAISRQAVCEIINDIRDCISVEGYCAILERMKKLPPVNPQEPKTGHCKDCKWWKDSDEVFRRGISMESLCAACHIYCKNGQESEDKE